MPHRDPLLRRVWELNRDYDLLPHGGVLLAAVSGGSDSMCLLSVLKALAPARGYTLSAAHYHHGLRGAEADRDAEFVRDWCQSQEIPFYLGRGDVAAEAKATGRGIEETARRMRYQFLERTALSLAEHTPAGCVIATAHNADDNAETILLHLVRGTGLQGLTGIAPKREGLIRPLLTCTRAEIEDYNRRWSIPHVEDSTNGDLSYSRNFLRHRVMPLLREMNPNLAQGLGRTAQSLRTDQAYLNERAAVILAQAEEREGAISIPAAALGTLPEAVQPRAVQLLYQRLLPEEILSMSHRMAVLALAAGDAPSGEIDLPGGLTALRQYDTLTIKMREPEKPRLAPVELPLPGTVIWDETILRAEEVVYRGEPQKRNELFLRADGNRLTVRTRRTGDRFRPVGRPEKTLKKWFIDEKIPREQRDRLPVLTDSTGQIVGVPGLGAAQSACPTTGERAWKITRLPAEQSIRCPRDGDGKEA
ncbi:MAG: tRNA lysidine(34) synthetase TilS [Oscillospiraceae bacterium]|nr:tRNA lysidine(34) synthetase TilS [Oscillospiraceae bacterium]